MSLKCWWKWHIVFSWSKVNIFFAVVSPEYFYQFDYVPSAELSIIFLNYLIKTSFKIYMKTTQVASGNDRVVQYKNKTLSWKNPYLNCFSLNPKRCFQSLRKKWGFVAFISIMPLSKCYNVSTFSLIVDISQISTHCFKITKVKS